MGQHGDELHILHLKNNTMKRLTLITAMIICTSAVAQIPPGSVLISNDTVSVTFRYDIQHGWSEYYIQDTVKVIMLVTDTTEQRNRSEGYNLHTVDGAKYFHLAYWIKGWQIIHRNRWGSYMGMTLDARTAEFMAGDGDYLDEQKRPLPVTVVVWMSKAVPIPVKILPNINRLLTDQEGGGLRIPDTSRLNAIEIDTTSTTFMLRDDSMVQLGKLIDTSVLYTTRAQLCGRGYMDSVLHFLKGTPMVINGDLYRIFDNNAIRITTCSQYKTFKSDFPNFMIPRKASDRFQGCNKAAVKPKKKPPIRTVQTVTIGYNAIPVNKKIRNIGWWRVQK